MSVERDLDKLVPAFRERVAGLVLRLQARGFKARAHETYRSPERARQLVAEGKSKSTGGLSMHCYGLAADIICADHKWACRASGCRFFAALGEEARVLGLVWGGDWDGDGDTKDQTFIDLPHVQAIPIGDQARVRAMPAEQVAAFAAQRLGARTA